MSYSLTDAYHAGNDTWAERIHRAARRGWTTLRGTDIATLIARCETYLAVASRLEDECDRLRAEVADREAVIARLQPTWETP